MLGVKLDTGFNIEVDFTLAPFGRRFVAWVIDVVICFAYARIALLLFGLTFDDPHDKIWLVVLISLPYLLYHLLCEIFLNGQSIGKKVMRLKVIAADGGQPSISQFLIRWMFRPVDFPVLILGAVFSRELPWWCIVLSFAGMACYFITPYSQRLGDLVAGTILIDTRNRTSWEDTVFTELEDNYVPRYPKVMKMTDKDLNTLKSIINTVGKNNDSDLALRIADRIQTKLDIQTDQLPLDFLKTLLKDYNYYSTR